MKRIAVIGLGIMGHGIADNFLKAGYELTVWNRTASKADDLVAGGAKLAESPKAATENVDIVFEVTANDESSRQVWFGDDGILAAATPDTICIAAATLSVDWIHELADKCSEQGITFFDMPMTGGRVAAESGQLTLLAGGDESKLEAIRPELAAVAKDVKYFSAAGAGTKYKLILNTLQAIHIAGFGEAMRMAKEAGLDTQKVGDALAERPGGVITGISQHSYHNQPNPITFSVEWIAKDLGYASKMAKDIKHPLLDSILQTYQNAIKQGEKDADWTKINEQ